VATSLRFSIVIPTYNYGRFLDRAVSSALAQPGDDFEVLVVDDGSTDDTPRVVERFGDDLRYVRQQNRGAAAARNRGAELAAGEWIVFLDADDRLLPKALAHFREATAAHAEAAMVFGHHVSVSEDGRRRETAPQPILGEPLDNFRRFVDRQFGIAHGTVAIRRPVFETLRYPPGISNGEDIVLFGQILALFPCATFPRATAEVHAHAGRMRSNVDAVLSSGMKTVDALFQSDLLPAEAMRCRRLFESRRWLSLARSLFKAGRFWEARRCYLQALRADWRRAVTVTNIGRFARCLLKSRRVCPAAPSPSDLKTAKGTAAN